MAVKETILKEAIFHFSPEGMVTSLYEHNYNYTNIISSKATKDEQTIINFVGSYLEVMWWASGH